MEEQEQPKIQLTYEQILEREIALQQTKNQLESTNMTIRQLENAIETNLVVKSAQKQINDAKKEVARLEHNIVALTEQINTKTL